MNSITKSILDIEKKIKFKKVALLHYKMSSESDRNIMKYYRKSLLKKTILTVDTDNSTTVY